MESDVDPHDGGDQRDFERSARRREPSWRRRRGSKKSDVERLFVALFPPEPIVRELLERASGLSLPQHRLVAAHQVHLTLAFLGNRRLSELPRLSESVERAAAGIAAFDLRLTEWCYLPAKAPPRVLTVAAEPHGNLLELERRLHQRLSNETRSKREYQPHLTVARLKNARDPMDMAPLPDFPASSFRAERIELLRSRLQPEGAEHITLLRVPLQGSGRSELD